MLPERWNEIKDKLHEALQLGPTRRAIYLAETGATDPDLQKELESLIASHERTGTDFLNMPVAELSSALAARGEPSWPLGRRIGPYQIVEQIGVGGMGEVYRGFRADGEYLKQVAVKLVHAGQNDFVIHRFKNERQILASLDHPNIARLLDGGRTEEGVPYFVMELIQGQPINDYCDEHKLPIIDRLELFLQVCSAVQYAHQRLIIHRDIKPSNILVTAEGIPKLLDFGIAKILELGAAQELYEPTLTLFRVLTPGYASPEQIKGEPITITSDVYSLGVVLYELLTGRSPYRVASRTAHELSRAACEDEPEKLSSAARRTQSQGNGAPAIAPAEHAVARQSSPEKLSKRLGGDLDNIVLMALRKEPPRRYPSVEQFSQDIRRHLSNLPVIAQADTASYRASKFIIRHKAAITAAMVVTLTLLVWMAVAAREAGIAQRRFNDVRALANSGATLALGQTGIQCTPPPDGMVGWWPGDGNANDVTGNGHNGTFNGTFGAGEVGPAFTFDGTHVFVDVPNASTLNPATITADAWIYVTGNTYFPNIIGKGNTGTYAESYALFLYTDGSANGKASFLVNTKGTSTGRAVAVATQPIPNNGWHFVAGTYDGTTVKVYVDGSLAGKTLHTGSIRSTNDDLLIGKVDRASSPYPTTTYFSGNIDEAELYNRALSATEIFNIWNAGKYGTCKSGEARRGIPESVTILDMIDQPGGAAKVAEKLAAARRSDPKAALFPQSAVNNKGYEHLYAGETKEAIEIMKLNAMAYPDSPNVYDALGDAYLADGQKDLARRNAKKTLELLASDTVDPPARRDLIKQNAEQKLKDLGDGRSAALRPPRR